MWRWNVSRRSVLTLLLALVASISSFASNSGAAAVPKAPGAPTALKATRANEAVLLSWQPPSKVGTSAITGYNVYVSPSALVPAACTNTLATECDVDVP